jgi:phosphatidylethanolamine/phosphatidyl-N-methylethanolamine N-methyltransferase
MLARAHKRVARKGLANVEALLEMDASHLDFLDAAFDSVMATFVMSVVPDPAKVLSEISRVTRPGGRVYLFNHFRAEEDETLLALVERKIAPASRKIGFHSDFSREQLDLEACDLQMIDEDSFGPLGMFTLLTLQKPA